MARSGLRFTILLALILAVAGARCVASCTLEACAAPSHDAADPPCHQQSQPEKPAPCAHHSWTDAFIASADIHIDAPAIEDAVPPAFSAPPQFASSATGALIAAPHSPPVVFSDVLRI